MDTVLNVALIGFGRFGKKYFKAIKKNKRLSLKVIFRKKIFSKNKYHKLSLKNIKSNKIKAAIVCTPVKTHFEVSKLFIKNRIPIILEKPAANNIKQIKKLIDLTKKYKSSVIVNHSDLFNQNLNLFISKIKLIGKINYFSCNFGKLSKIYTDKDFLPHNDWLPHPLAIIIKLFKKINNVKILSNNIKIQKKIIYQSMEIILKCKENIRGKIIFSNKLRSKKRVITLYGKKGLINYDGYNVSNNFINIKKKEVFGKSSSTSLENILEKLYQSTKRKKFYSDLELSLNIEKILTKIKKGL